MKNAIHRRHTIIFALKKQGCKIELGFAEGLTRRGPLLSTARLAIFIHKFFPHLIAMLQFFLKDRTTFRYPPLARATTGFS